MGLLPSAVAGVVRVVRADISRSWTHGVLLWLAVCHVHAFAQEQASSDAPSLSRIVVTGRAANLIGAADSATEGTITASQLATRPLLRSAEVLELVPGMIVTQHSGDGKANQYFLRGFNLDHGSDFATYVNGMPVNEVSHAHGQGYTDLNFLIPELVANAQYRKGPYRADDGDIATTGSARLQYARTVATPFIEAVAGAHGFRRLLAAGSTQVFDRFDLLSALEGGTNDGPWEQPERLHRMNGVLRLSRGNVDNGFAVTAMTYRSRWTATEQVPQRAIADGEIGRYGTLASTDGGTTYRHSLSGEWARSDERSRTRLGVYAIRYGLNLFSTPAGLQDSQHEQADRRLTWGLSAAQGWMTGWKDTEITLGIQTRQDRIPRIGLFHTLDRVRTDTVREDRITQTSLGVYVETHTNWLSWLRSTIALRGDQVRAQVDALGGIFNETNGGRVRGSQTSPKVSIAFGPFRATEFYVNWGQGFHSNDMRGATTHVDPTDGSPQAPVVPLAKVTSAEVGMRAAPTSRWNTTVSVWTTRLSSELVFIGDEGVTEPRGASRRYGVEWANDVALSRWLSFDADVALSHARFVAPENGGTHVPNAIPRSASFGMSADPGGAWFAGMRFRHIAGYDLEETGTYRSSASQIVNLKAGYRFGPSVRLTLDVLNLFDRKANDIEYWGTSCTRSEGPACNGGNGYEGRLVHPMEPRTVRVALRSNF